MPDPESTTFHDWLVHLRRHFHQFPELAYRETETAGKITEVLEALNVPHRGGIGGTGVVAMLEAKRSGPTVALRADMDALPITEQNDVPYRSKHLGRMHACGHDGHVTMALGALRLLQETRWTGTGCGRVIVVFQPAEEGGAGARAMLETAFLEGEDIRAFFAGHMHPELPLGHIGMSEGVTNASSDTISIRLKGKGGHGAHPHLCIDPIVGGAHLVTALQTIVSRNISSADRAVLTIGRFHAGIVVNIIPHEAVLEGTLRTLSEPVRDQIVERIHEMVQGVASAHRLTAEVTITPGYPLVVNNKEILHFTVREARSLLGEDRVHLQEPRMGAEDFAYFLRRFPGVLIRLGCHDPEKGFEHGLHSPHFDFDERTLEVGARLFTQLLTRFTESHEAVGSV